MTANVVAENAFATGSLRILVADTSSNSRQAMVEALRGLGFKNLQSVSSSKDVWGVLEVEPVEWVIMPLFGDQQVTAMHILKLMTTQPKLRNLRVSLLVEQSETKFLPFAFEMGLLSWFERPTTKEKFSREMNLLLKRVETNRGNSCLTAAEYLREVLAAPRWNKMALDFEKTLVKTFPSVPALQVNLAKALFRNGQKPQAIASLKQVHAVEPTLEKIVQPLIAEYSKGLKEGAVEPANVNPLGLRTCLVVDPDTAVQKTVDGLLRDLGAPQIVTVGDGEAAWEWLEKNPAPSLIVQEWKLPKVSGPALVQRVRGKQLTGSGSGPGVVVLSSLVKTSDQTLLREMGVASVVEKPVDREIFIKAIMAVLQQESVPTEARSMERQVRALLHGGKFDQARALYAKIKMDKNFPEGQKYLIAGEFEFLAGKYSAAQDLAVEGIKRAGSGDSLFGFSLIGKCLLKQGQFENALKFLAKAQDLSPQNLERLCTMAELKGDLGDTAGAKKDIGNAKDIDQNSTSVAAAELNIAVRSGEKNKTRELIAKLGSTAAFVSVMNNKAVALARCGRPKESLVYYNNAMDVITPDAIGSAAALRYNLALAYVRMGEEKNAIVSLGGPSKNVPSRLEKKMQILKSKLTKAVGEKKPVRLNERKVSAAKVAATVGTKARENKNDGQAELHQKRYSRGEFCCYQVFGSTELVPDVAVSKMLANLPRFNLRTAIKRP